jgi:hypothetical protein
MMAKLIRLTHKIAIQLHLVADNCTICISRAEVASPENSGYTLVCIVPFKMTDVHYVKFVIDIYINKTFFRVHVCVCVCVYYNSPPAWGVGRMANKSSPRNQLFTKRYAGPRNWRILVNTE